MTIDPQALFALLIGPGGLLVALSIAVWQLWQAHKKADADNASQLERQLTVNEGFAAAMPGLTEAVKTATGFIQDLSRRGGEAYSDPAPRPPRRAPRTRAATRED